MSYFNFKVIHRNLLGEDENIFNFIDEINDLRHIMFSLKDIPYEKRNIYQINAYNYLCGKLSELMNKKYAYSSSQNNELFPIRNTEFITHGYEIIELNDCIKEIIIFI